MCCQLIQVARCFVFDILQSFICRKLFDRPSFDPFSRGGFCGFNRCVGNLGSLCGDLMLAKLLGRIKFEGESGFSGVRDKYTQYGLRSGHISIKSIQDV